MKTINKYITALIAANIVLATAFMAVLGYVAGTHVPISALVFFGLCFGTIGTISSLLVLSAWIRREQVLFLTRETIIYDDRT